MSLQEVIFTQVFNKVLDRLLKPEVPVRNADAPAVAKQITQDLAPVIVNQTNNEPLYKSRIMRGLFIAAAGVLGSWFRVQITDGDLEQGIHAITTLIEAIGIIYALYGRVTSKGTPQI